MSAALKPQERHVIPRWRDARTTGQLGELDPSSEKATRIIEGEEFFREKIEAWNRERTLGIASDLLGAALVLRKFEEADDAARYVIASGEKASAPMRAIAERILQIEESIPSDEKPPPSEQRPLLFRAIRGAREMLRDDPRNAIAWVELARAYTSLGVDSKAKRAMHMAVTLADDNRFVLRSASRLAVHVEEKQRAHELLRRTPATREDPWLLASEIAAADLNGKTSRFVKRGREMLASADFSPFHLAELATAIGSLELKAGNAKAARKLFQTALRQPTENSLAQIEWASERVSGIQIDPQQFAIPYSHEARALYSHSAADWKRAVAESIKWLADEPFSTHPAVLGSFIAAEYLEDFSLAQEICNDGLIASPSDATLLNNLAFALANEGKLKEAQDTLNLIPLVGLPTATDICRDATQGLIAFRQGDHAKGRFYYDGAMSKADQNQFLSLKIRAGIHLAREELEVDTTKAGHVIQDVIKMAKRTKDPDLLGTLERLLDSLLRHKSRKELDAVITDIRRILKPSKQPLPNPSGVTF